VVADGSDEVLVRLRFVPAGVEHRMADFSDDQAFRVRYHGPAGGDREGSGP
jgi:hypothetical protein